jgi:cytochrome c biogenesis protein CcdA
MLDRLLFAYTSGLLAAVSPCVIVLIPLCLVRFVRQEATGARGGGADSLAAVASAQGRPPPPATPSLLVELSLFLLGFQVSYILFGFLLSSILTSRIQDGFKLALGTLFLVSSILAWQGRVDPLRLPLVDSAFWTGVSFALLLSFNPCTVPFLALLISVNDSASTLLALLCFAQGLITPALLVVAMGSRILSWLEESAFKMERVKPWTYALLGGSGIYLLAAPVYTMSAEDS